MTNNTQSLLDRADAERLRQFDKWADQGLCPHLVFNDNGWWAVTFDGGGDMSLIEPPPDGVFTAIVESTQWRQTVVEAIDAAIAARAQAEKEGLVETWPRLKTWPRYEN